MEKSRSTRETIWEALCDLHAQEQIATREVLSAETGLSMTIVDEHVKNLINDGRVRRAQRGVFVPVEIMPPARAVSTTIMASGMTKLEIGDAVLDLTPREARMLGTSLAGFAVQYSNIQAGHEIGRVTSEFDLALKRAVRVIDDLTDRIATLEGRPMQGRLELTGPVPL